MPDEQSGDRRPRDRRLEDIFGSELSPGPPPESRDEHGRSPDEEYLENRPPHHDDGLL